MSTDLIVMEYHSLGQTIYENVPMLLMTVAVYVYFQFRCTDSPHAAQLLGITSASLALFRASYSYFFVVPLLFIMLAKKTKMRRQLLAFALCILLQIGWNAKNYLVYGYATLSTSSWAGLNCAIGLGKVGISVGKVRMHKIFLRTIVSEAEQYPPWFVNMLKQEGMVEWHPPVFKTYVPENVKQQEAHLQRILHNTNRSENSIGQRLVSDLYMKAWARFAVKYPDLMIEKFARSYSLFWQPIRNFSDMYLGGIFVKRKVTNSFQFSQIWQAYFSEAVHEQHYFLQGPIFNKGQRPINIYAIPYLPSLILVINLVVLHSVVPALVVGDMVRRLTGKTGIVPLQFYFLVTCYVYVAVIMNISEHGENMRFRLSIEPVIWTITVYALSIVASLFVSMWRHHKAA